MLRGGARVGDFVAAALTGRAVQDASAEYRRRARESEGAHRQLPGGVNLEALFADGDEDGGEELLTRCGSGNGGVADPRSGTRRRHRTRR